jgi:polyisoprenoid-binding protein YceI
MKKIILILLMLFSFNYVYSTEYHVDKSNNNVVKFLSEATMEKFEGITNKIDGYMMSEDISKLIGSEFYFEVDLNSVKTGNGLMERHMREDYLQTDKYQFTNIKGKITEAVKISETEYNIKAGTQMFIHGVTHDIIIPGKIYILQNGIKIKSNYSIKLPDYKIEVPKFMFMRVSEEIKLELDFIVKPVK